MQCLPVQTAFGKNQPVIATSAEKAPGLEQLLSQEAKEVEQWLQECKAWPKSAETVKA